MRTPRSIKRALGKAWLAAFGWSVDDGASGVPKGVLIAAPHTSNWDLPFMLAISYVLDIEVHWLGKHTLFSPPLGPLLKRLGGIPIDRRTRQDAVSAGVEALRARPSMLLAVPPEGTRAKSSHWKTGFYWIARGADVPILFGYLDYGKKRGGIARAFHPTGDIVADMAVLRDFYAEVTGKYPDQASDIVLRPKEKAD